MEPTDKEEPRHSDAEPNDPDDKRKHLGKVARIADPTPVSLRLGL